jgi:hypothetical protein
LRSISRFSFCRRSRGICRCKARFAVIQTPSTSLRAKRSNPSCGITDAWIASSQALLAKTASDIGHKSAFSRPETPEVCKLSLKMREQGMPGARCTRGLVCKQCAKNAHEHTGTDGTLRHSLRNGFTAYIVLSPENGSFASVIGGTPPANLTPAPRRQDHTTSPYASVTLVGRDISVHRISPHVRDDREAPLIRRETRGVMPLICPTARDEYFCSRVWTDFWVICPSGCFVAGDTAFRHCERSEASHSAAC